MKHKCNVTEATAVGGEQTYDVFISYSHRDEGWVTGTLLPRLEAAGLQVCIDFRDFRPGRPSLVNMENAVERSRKTLLVLTPAWVESEWTDFESLLIQSDDPAERHLTRALTRCRHINMVDHEAYILLDLARLRADAPPPQSPPWNGGDRGGGASQRSPPLERRRLWNSCSPPGQSAPATEPPPRKRGSQARFIGRKLRSPATLHLHLR